MTRTVTVAEIDQLTDALWAPVTARGHRVDMVAAFAAHRVNPGDGMIVQLKRGLRPGGRVHPTFRAAGAVTGRMAATGPNVQGLSERYRHALLADPGMVLVACDLDHVEPSVAAALSGDRRLAAACAPGSDPYLATASIVAGQPVTEAGDPRRKAAKVTLLSLLYGKGARTLATDLTGAPDPTAQQVAAARWVRGQVLAAYPQLAAWSAELVARAEAGGQLFTAYGRDVSDVGGESYKAVNYVVQGTAADFFKLATLNVDAALTAAGMPRSPWLPIHDELVIQVPEERAVEAACILQTGMCGQLLGVPIGGTAVVLGHRFGK